jgi:hypothetical protein
MLLDFTAIDYSIIIAKGFMYISDKLALITATGIIPRTHNDLIIGNLKQLFTRYAPTWSLSDYCVFGCLAYVLHRHLQDGDSLGKWEGVSAGSMLYPQPKCQQLTLYL